MGEQAQHEEQHQPFQAGFVELRRVARERAAIRELERPGNAGQLSPQLGIDEVGDAHQPERHRHAGGDDVEQRPDRYAAPPGEQDHGERGAQKAAMERHAALPDGDDVLRIGDVALRDRRTACSRCGRRARRRSPPRPGSRRDRRASSALAPPAIAAGWRPAAWRTTRRTGCRRCSPARTSGSPAARSGRSPDRSSGRARPPAAKADRSSSQVSGGQNAARTMRQRFGGVKANGCGAIKLALAFAAHAHYLE